MIATARPILQSAVAASLAWLVATELVGHAAPFFAPISAVITLGLTVGERRARAVELGLGVAVGIAIADLLVALIGTGAWQIGVVVALAMFGATLVGGGPLLASQAAASAVLVATLQPPDGGVRLHARRGRRHRRRHRPARRLGPAAGRSRCGSFGEAPGPVDRRPRGGARPHREGRGGPRRGRGRPRRRGGGRGCARSTTSSRTRSPRRPTRPACRSAGARRSSRSASCPSSPATCGWRSPTRARSRAASAARSRPRTRRRPRCSASIAELADGHASAPPPARGRRPAPGARGRRARGGVANAVLEETGNMSALHIVGQVRLLAVDILRATGMERHRRRTRCARRIDPHADVRTPPRRRAGSPGRR